MDQQCVKVGDPDKSKPKKSDIIVPLHCCGTRGNCAAPSCDHEDTIEAVPKLGKLPDPTEMKTIAAKVERDENTCRPYLVSTVDGITQEAFEAFAGQPPLHDKKGDIMADSYVPWVSCQYLDLSDADAALIRKNPIVAFVEPITED